MVGSTPRLRKTKPRNLRSYGSSRQSSTRITSASPNSSRTNRTRTAEARAVVLESCTDISSETRSQNRSLAASLEQARTSWWQPCYCVTCLSPRTPRHGAFETKCGLCSMWRQLSRPRAQPLDVGGQLRKNAPSRPVTRGRCRSIKNHPLEEGKQRQSWSTLSIINGGTTLGTTSTSIAAAGTGTQRSAATAPTTVDDTTATKTEWLQNHRALESSAEQSIARHFDP